MQRAITLLRALRRRFLPRNTPPSRAHVDQIDANELTGIVRTAVAEPSFTLSRWQATPFGTGASRESRLLRLYGTGSAGGVEQNWSLILKIVRRLGDEGDPYAGLREALAYESGILQAQWQGEWSSLVAPTCYGVHPKSVDESWIWLEEVREESNSNWTLQNYTLAARHLGRFNSYYLARPLPAHPWLAHNRLAEWMRLVAPAVAHLPTAMTHPLMQHAYPGALAQEVLQLWDERARFLQALTTLPTTLCHGDAFRQNLFARHNQPNPCTIAIDWAQIGLGPAGEDLASLVCVALSFYEIKAEEIATVDPLLFQSYLAGLREGAHGESHTASQDRDGWQGSDEQVRLGYTIAAALRYGIGVLGLILAIVGHEKHQQQAAAVLGRPIEEVMQGYAHMTRYALACANEARSIISR